MTDGRASKIPGSPTVSNLALSRFFMIFTYKYNKFRVMLGSSPSIRLGFMG